MLLVNKPRPAIRIDGRRVPVYKPCVRPLAVLRARVRKAQRLALMLAYREKIRNKLLIVAPGGAPLVLTSSKGARRERGRHRPGEDGRRGRRRRRPGMMSPRVEQTWYHAGETTADPRFPNEPPGMTIGWDDDMSTDYSYTQFGRHPGTHNTTDPDEGQATPGTSNQANWLTGAGYPAQPEFGPPGLGNASGQFQVYSMNTLLGAFRPREMYQGVWVRPSSNFQFHNGGLTKTVWFGVDGSREPNQLNDAEPDLGAAFCIGPSGSGESFHLRVAPQYPRGNGAGGARWLCSAGLTKGAWNLIEIYGKGNSAGVADGIFKLWLNGVLQINLSDIIFNTIASGIIGRFSGTKFDPYWGGTGDTLLVDCNYKYDHYRVSYRDLLAA